MHLETSAVADGRREKPRARARRAAAAVELVLTLPMLCFICLTSIDFSRLFFAWATIADCARDGALYATDTSFKASTGYPDVQTAALANATNLSPPPTVMPPTYGPSNSYVEVTVSYQFQTLANYPGIPTSMPLTRTLRMSMAPP